MKQRIKGISVTILILLATYSLMLYPHYSADSFYYHENRIANSEGTGNLALGRFGNYFVNKIVAVFDFDCIKSQFICTVFLMLCLAFATEVICHSFNKCYKNDWQKALTKLAVLVSFCNVFLLEWFVFVEATFQWAFSVIFMALAFMQLHENFSWKRVIFCFLLQSISVGFYQATIGYFVIFSLLWVFICCGGVLNKKSILLNIKVLLCGGSAGLSNVLLIRILQKIGRIHETNRTSTISISTVLENIKSIWNNREYLLIKNFNLFPPYILILFVAIAYILVIWHVLHTDRMKMLNQFIYLLLLVICCRGIIYFPHIISSHVWMAQRTVASFWTIISIPVIVACSLNVNRQIGRIFMSIIGVVLFINIIYTQFISIEVVANNKIDEQISYYIYDRIVDYEAETGINITKIAICNDNNISWGYDAIRFRAYDLNIRAFAVNWACVESINYYNHQNYQRCDMESEIFEKYFAGKDWNVFNIEEQMVFVDDVLYLAIY